MGYSRREAIKCIGAGTLLLMGEIYGRPIGRLAELIPGQEGNPAQRYAIFSKITSQIALHPNNPKPRQILKSWLAFNGAEFYLNSHNLSMSSELYRHFLYGKGESVNISTHISRIFPPTKNLHTPHTSIDHHLAQSFMKRSKPPIRILKTSETGIEVRGVTLADHPDMDSSLGNFTFTIAGNIDPNSMRKENKSVCFSLTKPNIKIYDKFDWDPKITSSVNIGITILSLSQELGIPVDEALQIVLSPEEYTQLLCCSADVISPKKGSLLVQGGYAQEYNVTTDKLTLDVPKIDLEIPTNML